MSEFLDLLDSLDGSGQVVSPDQDDSNVFARKFKESFAQTGANLKGGFGALVGDEALMDDALSDQQDASIYYGKEGDVNDVFEVESVGDLGNYVAGVTGSAAGSLVQIGAGGGVFGAAAKGMAKRGAKQALNKRLGAIAKDRAGSGAATSLGKATADMVADVARKEAVEGVAKKVGRAQLVGGSAGMVATSFPQLSGASALEIYRETGDINAGAAFLTGALQTLPDVFPVLREFKKLGLGKVAGEKVANALVKDEIKFKRLMKSVAKTGSIEGGTEILQDVIGNVTLEILNENKDHFSVSDIKGFINSGIGGFAGGVMMGAPSASIEAFKSDDPWFKAYEIEQNTLKEAGLKAVDSGDDVALAQVKRQMEENKAVKDKKISELLNAQGKQVDTADLFADKVRLYRDKPDSFGAYGDSLKPIRDRALSDIQSEANKAKVAGDEALFDALIGEYQALQGDDSVEATTGGDTFSSVTRVLDKDTGEAVPVENKISDARQRQIDIQSNVQTQSVEELLKADSAPEDSHLRDGLAPDETLIPQDVNEDFPLGVNEPMTGLDYTEQDYLDQVAGVALDDQEKNVSSFDKQGNNDGDYGKTDSVADDVSPSKDKAGVGAEAVDGQAGEVANSGIEDFRSNIPSIGGENTPSTGGGKFNPTHVLEDGTEVVAVDGWDGVYEDSNGESFELESDDVQLLSPSVKGALKQKIEVAAKESATSPANNLPEPSQAQKEAGNYKVGKVSIHGLDVSIENPKGSQRKGVDKDGKPWSVTMKQHYGYVRGTEGADGDHVDVFIGDGVEDASRSVYVVDQVEPTTNKFDKHKVMMGFKDKASAEKAYRANYDKDWQGLGAITEMPLDAFKTWVKSGKAKKPLAWFDWKKKRDLTASQVNGVSSLDPTTVDEYRKYRDIAQVDKNLGGYGNRPRKFKNATEARKRIEYLDDKFSSFADELSRAAQDKSSFDAYAIPGVGVNSDAWKLFVDYRKKIGEPITEAQQTYKSAGHLNSLSASDQKMLVEQTIKNKNIIVDRYLDKESDNTEKVNKSTKPEIFEPTHVDGKGIEHQFYEGRWWDEWGEVSGSEKKRPKGIRKIKKGQGKIDGVKLVKLFNNKFTESEIQEYIDETREVTTKPLVNGSKKTKVMTYEQYLNESDKLQKLVDSASDKLKKYDTQRDNKGLLPDDVRKGDAYKKDKGRFDDAFERLREYNSTVPKAFMQRASAERRVKKVNSEVSDESTKLDKSSKGTLAGVSAGEVQGTAKSKKTGTGTTGSSRNDVAGNESVDGWRGTGNGSVGDGTGEVSVSSGGKPARGILSKKSDVGGAADGESVKAVGGKSRNGDGRGVPEAVDEVGRGRAGLSEPETHLMDNGVPIRVRRAVAAKHNYSIDPAVPKLKKQVRDFEKQSELDALIKERVDVIAQLQKKDDGVDDIDGKKDGEQVDVVESVKDDVSFKLDSQLASKKSIPVTKKEFSAVVDSIFTFFKSGTVVNQVLSASELPVAIHESAFKQGFDISTVQGVMHDGAIYVVRENVHSSKQLEEVIYHELYGHYGLRKLYGKKLDRRLINFWNAIGCEAGLDKLAKKYGIEKNIATYKKAKGWKIPAQRNAMLMDELLAHVAQKETGSLKQKALEIIGVVRQWLRGHGFKWLGKMNRADIALVLRDARGAVVKGNMADGSDVRFSLAASDDVFSDIDKTLDDKKGVKSVKDALAKSFEYVKDRAHEFSKNGGLSLLTLRQLTDVGEKVLPMAKEYMLRVERMLTERNKMQDESAKLALRWQALNKKVRNRLAHVMHESTLLGVDPSYSEFQTAKVQVIGGMIAVRRAMGEDVKGEYSTKVELVESNEANLKLLAKRKYKAQTALRNARTTDKDAMSAKRDAHKLAIKEWKAMRNAIIKDIRRKKKFDGLRHKFEALDEGAQAIFVEARDMYLARSERTEKALMSKIRSAGMTEAQSKKAMQMIRMEFESARLDGVYFPLFRKGDYFVRAEKLRTDIIEPSVYLKNDGRIEERENKGTGEKAYFIGKRSFKTLDEAYEANKYWGDAESAMGAMHSRPDLIGKSLVAEEVSPGRFVLKDKMTEFEFTMHNTAREAERYMDAMGSEYSVKRFGKLDKVQTKEDFSVSGSFLADVFGVMDDGGVTDDVKDSIYQVYLETLPELSQRKHFIHRKMTVGFSDDALQAFANNMGHQAHQVSKLEASDGLQEALDDVADHAKQVDQADAVLAGNLRDELKLRHEWVMNPDNAGWTNKTSAFGFFMYLGASPASALVNLTQTAVVAYPILASEFGWKSAGKALARAGSELNMRETVLGDGAIDTTGLTHSEGRALQAWYDEGVIDRSQAHMLAGIGDSDSLQNSPGYQKWMGLTAHLFHKAEIVNREVTLLAGYRLAIEAGVPHDAAVAKSSEMTWEAHFDYSNANRARMMQGDFAKLFLMFRSYSQHMIYFMLKNANDWGKGGVEGKKAQARLLGMLGVTFAMGGASALPVGMVGGATALAYVNKKYGTKRAAQLGAMGGLLFMASLLWDDDEPLDWETETKAALREMGGDTLEALVFRGVINAGTGINVSSRISLDDLLVRSPNREMEGRDLASHYLSQAAGPVVGYGTGLFSVPDLIREDHSARALEKVAPKFLRDYVKALRYGGEGVLNMRGDAVVEKDLMGFFSDDISLWNIFWQAQGFSPEDVGRQYGKTNEIKNYEGHIQRKKKRILSQYFIARKENDGKGMAYALERAKAWNKANPKAKQLDQKALNRSFKTRMRYSNQSLNGANVSKQYRYLVDELNAG